METKESVIPPRRRSLKHVFPVEPEYFLQQIEKAFISKRNLALASMLYLGGFRVGELPMLKTSMVEVEQRYSRYENKLKTFVVVRKAPVLKKRDADAVRHLITIPAFKSYEKPFLDYFYDYHEPLTNDEILFPMGARHIRKLIWRIKLRGDPCFPHWVRSLRCMHLLQRTGCNVIEIKNFFNWSTVRMVEEYVRFVSGDIADRMMQVSKFSP